MTKSSDLINRSELFLFLYGILCQWP